MSLVQTVPFEEKIKPMNLDPLPEQPLVSVMIANYNYAKFIGEAVESVLNQTYRNFEIVICDDGSTDNSCEVIECYACRDSRIKLVRKENGGIASAFNAAYARSSGQVICLLDADDTFAPAKIEKVIAAFLRRPQAGLGVHFLQRVSPAGEIFSSAFPLKLDEGWIPWKVLTTGGCSDYMPVTSALSFRREITNEIFPLPTELARGCDEYMARIALFLTEVSSVEEVLSNYRLHGQNMAGMLSVSASTIRRTIGQVQANVSAQREFLARRWGKELAECIRLDDNVGYWEHILALYLLDSEPGDTICGYSKVEILAHLPEKLRKHFWRLLLSVPRKVGRRGLKLWWTPAPWKKFIWPVSKVFRYR